MTRAARSASALALLLSLAACSSPFSAEDAPASDGPGAPGATAGSAEPAPPPVTGAPREDELTEKFGVFVAPHGKDEAEGTRAAPLASIAKAIAKAKTNKRRVYVCAGTYREALALEDGVSVIGGYACAGAWKVSNERARIEAPTSPAIQARNIVSTTRLDGFDVVAPEGNAQERSSIALIAENANGLTIARGSLEAKVAANGADGASPAPAVHTGDPNGAESILQSRVSEVPGISFNLWLALRTPRAGAAGGSGGCSAGGNAGNGGRGQGAYAYVYDNRGGGGPAGFGWYVDSKAPELREVLAPTSGADGADGESARPGAFSAAGYAPGNGSAGTNGAPGTGGSGGASDTDILNQEGVVGDIWFASTGGGGGAGGCAGLAGTAGQGGGASVALLAAGSARLALTNVSLKSADGGRGGAGSLGAPPTVGGAWGGSPRAPVAQHGGRGGVAGTSGSGAGGPSYALVAIGGAPKREDVTYEHGAGGAGAPELGTTFTLTRPKGGATDAIERTIPASTSGSSGDVLEL